MLKRVLKGPQAKLPFEQGFPFLRPRTKHCSVCSVDAMSIYFPLAGAIVTLLPTNMEMHKAPFQEESRLSTGVCAQTHVGRVSLGWTDGCGLLSLQQEDLCGSHPYPGPAISGQELRVKMR